MISCLSFDWISAELAVGQAHDPDGNGSKGKA
jgi:hypothetical protein